MMGFGLFSGLGTAIKGLGLGAFFIGGAIAGVLVTGLFMHYAYQGLTIPFPWPIPDLHITDGWVKDATDEATRHAKVQCDFEKESSRIQAARVDAALDNLQLQQMQILMQEASAREQEARDDLETFKADNAAEDAADAAAGRPVSNCRIGERGARGLQRRNLPYPGASVAPN